MSGPEGQIESSVDRELKLVDGLNSPREIDLSILPTRRERMGYEWIPSEEDRRNQAPRWAQYVECPVCKGQMTLIKLKKDTQWGHNLTFQCHNTKAERHCLAVVQLTTGSTYYMRPGDFEFSDFDWRKVAIETVEVCEGDTIIQSPSDRPIDRPVLRPYNPWKRTTSPEHILWNLFWDDIMKVGFVSYEDMCFEAEQIRDDLADLPRYKKIVQDFPAWIEERSGYTVHTDSAGIMCINGRGRGSKEGLPYSDKEYRQQHGFEA